MKFSDFDSLSDDELSRWIEASQAFTPGVLSRAMLEELSHNLLHLEEKRKILGIMLLGNLAPDLLIRHLTILLLDRNHHISSTAERMILSHISPELVVKSDLDCWIQIIHERGLAASTGALRQFLFQKFHISDLREVE